MFSLVSVEISGWPTKLSPSPADTCHLRNLTEQMSDAAKDFFRTCCCNMQICACSALQGGCWTPRNALFLLPAVLPVLPALPCLTQIMIKKQFFIATDGQRWPPCYTHIIIKKQFTPPPWCCGVWSWLPCVASVRLSTNLCSFNWNVWAALNRCFNFYTVSLAAT